MFHGDTPVLSAFGIAHGGNGQIFHTEIVQKADAVTALAVDYRIFAAFLAKQIGIVAFPTL